MHIKRENETEKDRERSVFSTVFLALVAVLAVEIAMLLLSFTLSGFTSRLNSNAEQILDKQVVNRAAYISGQLIEAQDLSGLDSAVKRAAAQLVQEGETVASLTSSNEGSAPLFDAVSDQMVRILREKNVTGVYIVLHTGELSRTAGGSLPCLYLRDLDPSAPASATNDDLLLEHAPAAVMHRMSISTSENWEPGIPVTGGAQDDFFRLPYDRAREDGGIQNAADYGRWSTESYTLAGDSRPVISYTQPLIYPDGTVYGVIGVELLTRYVQSLLPYSELQNDGFGTYLLARSPDITQDSSMTLHSVVTSAADSGSSLPDVFTVDMQSESGGWTRFGGWRCYASVVPLSLYSRNAPFSEGSHWMLVGTVSTTRLFAFSRSVQERLVITILLTVLVGPARLPVFQPQTGRADHAPVGRGRRVREARPGKPSAPVAHRHRGAGPLCGRLHRPQPQHHQHLDPLSAHHRHGERRAGRLRAAGGCAGLYDRQLFFHARPQRAGGQAVAA